MSSEIAAEASPEETTGILGNVVHAITCIHPFQPLTVTEIELPPLKDDEVEVLVEYCGICASGKKI